MQNLPGTPVAGAIDTVVADPFNANILYVGTVGGGLWKTENYSPTAGDAIDNDLDGLIDQEDPSERLSWRPLTEQFPTTGYTEIAFDLSDTSGNTFYVGTGKVSSSGMNGPGFGLLKTTDGGDTWEILADKKLIGANVTGLIVDGSNIFVSTSTTGKDDVGGLLISTNGGISFAYADEIGTGLPDNGVSSIALDRDAGILYAGLPGEGVYSSSDNGATWNTVFDLSAPATSGTPAWSELERDIANFDRVIVSVSAAQVDDGSADDGNHSVFVGLIATPASTMNQAALATDTVINVRAPERFAPGETVQVLQALSFGKIELQFSAAGNSVTRVDGGTWSEDGFAAGLSIQVQGTTANADTGYIVQSISGDGKTLFFTSAKTLGFDDTAAAGNDIRLLTPNNFVRPTIDWIDPVTGDIHLTAALGQAFSANAIVSGDTRNDFRLTQVFRSKDLGQNWVDLGTPGSLETYNDSNGIDRQMFFTVHPSGQAEKHTSFLPDPFEWENIYVGGDTNFIDDVAAPSSGTDKFHGRLFVWDGIDWQHAASIGANNTAPHADSRNMIAYQTGPGDFVILQVDDGGIYQLNNPDDQPSRRWSALIGDLNLTEFYSVVWNEAENLILGGAQDNGSALQDQAGLADWTTVYGGDGAIAATAGDTYYTTFQNFGGFTAIEPLLTVADDLTFLPVASVDLLDLDATGSLTRSIGNFLDDGFRTGEILRIKGSNGFDGTYMVGAIHANGLEMDLRVRSVEAQPLGDLRSGVSFDQSIPRHLAIINANGPAKQNTDLLSFVNNGATGSIVRSANGVNPVGDWQAEGFVANQNIVVTGSGANDGIYQVTAVTPTTLTVTFGDGFRDIKSFSAFTNQAGVQVQSYAVAMAETGGYEFISPYAINSEDGDRLIIARGSSLFETFDGGITATLLNGVMVGSSVPNSSRLAEINSIVAGGRASNGSAQADIAWVGTDRGTNGVTLWVRAPGQTALAPVVNSNIVSGVIRDVAIDPQNWQHVYAVDSKGNVWFSDTVAADPVNGTFTQLTGNLGTLNGGKDLQTITVVNAAGSDTPVLLVGAAGGVYRHIGNTAGTAWTEFGSDMPDVLVTDLSYSVADDVLLAGTLGRGAWTMDKASWLVGNSPELRLTGSGADDVFEIARDAQEKWLLNVSQYQQGDTPPAEPQLQVNVRGLENIVITGAGGDDVLNIDDGAAPLVVSSNIDFSGGAGADTLNFTGPVVPNGYAYTESSDLVDLGGGASFYEVSAISPFGVTESQRIDWTSVETVALDGSIALSLTGLGAGLQSLADALSGGVLAESLASEVLAGLALSSLDGALNNFITEAPRVKDEAFFDVRGINPDGATQLQNRGTLIERMFSEGPNGFSIADIGEDGDINTLAGLEAALVALGATVLRDEVTDRDSDGNADWFLDVQLQRELEGFLDLTIDTDIGIELDGLLGVAMDVQLDLAFGFDGSGFFVDTSGTGPELQVLDMRIADGASASGRIGFLGVEMLDAELTLDPDVSIDFNFSDPASGAADDLIRVSELVDPSYRDSVDANIVNDPGDGTADVQLDGVFGIQAIVPGFEDGIDLAESGIRLSWDDLAQPQAVTATATLQAGPDGQAMLDFLEYNSDELIAALTQLKDQLSVFESELPFLDESLNTLLDVITKFQEQVLDPLNNPASGRVSIPTVQELAAELTASLGITLADFGLAYDATSKELTFNISLLEELAESFREIRYGVEVEDSVSGLIVDTTATTSIDASFDFTLGIDFDNVLAGDSATDYLFIRDAMASGTINLDIADFDAAARFGFLGIEVVDGTATADPTFVVSLTDPATNAVDGRIDLQELIDAVANVTDLTELSVDGSAEFFLPIGVPFLGVVADPDPLLPNSDPNPGYTGVTVTLGDIDDPDTWTVSPAPLPSALTELPNFNNMDAAGLVSMLARFRDALNELVAGEPFNLAEIPLAGPVIGQVVNLADAIGDALLFDDADDDKDSSDYLITDINEALSSAGLQGRVRAEAVGNRIQFRVIDPSITGLSIQRISGGGPYSELGFNFPIQAAVDDGFALKILATSDAPADGTLSAAIDFALNVNTVDGLQFTEINLPGGQNIGLGNDVVKLVDQDNNPTFTTTQQLVERLAEILGISPGIIGASYDSVNKILTYNLDIDTQALGLTQPGVELPIDFNFELGSVADVSSDSTIRLDASAGLSLVLGIDLKDADSSRFIDSSTLLADISPDGPGDPLIKTLPAVTSGSIYGRLTDDVTIDVSINGAASIPVTVTQLTAANNRTPDDLVTDLNAALTSAGLDTQLVASADSLQILLTATDPSITQLTVDAAADQVAFGQLGLYRGQAAALEDGQLVLRANSSLASRLAQQSVAATFEIDVGNTGSGVLVTVNAPQADEPSRDDLKLAAVVNNALAAASLDTEIEAGIAGGRLVFTSLTGTAFTIKNADAEAQDKFGLEALDTASTLDDLVFYLSDGSILPVSLDGALTLGDVIAAINTGTGAAVTADTNTAGTALKLTDNSFQVDAEGSALPGQQRFRVDGTNGSKVALRLGIGVIDAELRKDRSGSLDGNKLGGLPFEERVFFENASISADASLTTPSPDPEDPLAPGINATATFGFVGVELTGNGDLGFALDFGLQEPTGVTPDGRLTVKELLDGLTTDPASVVATPTLTGSGLFELDLAITPSVDALVPGLDPSLDIEVVGFGDPFGDPFVSPSLSVAGLGDYDVGDPLTSDIKVTFSDLGDLSLFANPDFNFSNILDALLAVAQFLRQFEGAGFLDDELPLIGVSIQDLLGYADRLDALVSEAQNNPAASLQFLESELKEAFGLSQDSDVIGLSVLTDDNGTVGDTSDDLSLLKLDLGLSAVFSEALNFNFDVPTIGDALVGSAGLAAEGSIDFNLDFGIDLDNPLDVYLFDTTALAGLFAGTGDNLTFRAALGGFGLTIRGSDSRPSNASINAAFDAALGSEPVYQRSCTGN